MNVLPERDSFTLEPCDEAAIDSSGSSAAETQRRPQDQDMAGNKLIRDLRVRTFDLMTSLAGIFLVF
jgi:hypothetical protein